MKSNFYRSAHEQRLERWLGVELLEKIRASNHYWPVPILNVPGDLFAYQDDIIGTIKGGGFSSLSDLISEATTGGKLQIVHFTKAGTTGVAGVMNSLARVGPNPAGVLTAAVFPAGESPTKAAPAGLGIGFNNAAGGDTLHLTTAFATCSIASQLLLLYDRFYQGNHDISVDPRTVTGTPTRYQSTAAKGCFASCEVSTALGAGTPTYEITYVDQDGNAAEAATSLLTIAGSAIVNRFPFATPDWNFRLNAGDNGVRALTNLNLSAASTGNLNVFLGKPLAWIPMPAQTYTPVILDGINSAFNLVQITDDACLCLLELFKSATTATNWTGAFYLVSG
jgi:hypothetical protein